MAREGWAVAGWLAEVDCILVGKGRKESEATRDRHASRWLAVSHYPVLLLILGTPRRFSSSF